MDHIVAVKHGGATSAENLANACLPCNRHKGTDLGSISERTGELVRFYNPRIDQWEEHFEREGATSRPRTEVGEVTVRVFEFNIEERVLEREALRALGRYP